MTNAVVVGVGNIYASESLFLSGIRPSRAANRISNSLSGVGEEIKNVLARAIESGGTTLRDFVNGRRAWLFSTNINGIRTSGGALPM